MSWSLGIPCQEDDQRIAEILELGLDQGIEDVKERQIVSHLLLESAAEPGVATVRELLSLSPPRRRALMDRARKSAGLATTGEVDRAQALRQMLRDDPPRPAAQPTRNQRGELIQQCPAEGCEAMSTYAGGAIAPVRARKWWCEAHSGLAEPGDLDDWEPETVRLDPLTGGLVFPEEQRLAAEHYQRLEEKRAEERRKRQEQLEAEAERLAILEEQLPQPIPAPDPYLALHQSEAMR
jgi:hypothetical protein